MKLSTQNKLLVWFSSGSAIVGCGLVVGIVLFVLHNNDINVVSNTTEGSISIIQLFTQDNPLYTIVPLAFFALYVPIIGFTLYITFEKTKAPEIVYYHAMLIGFFAHAVLLCIPIFSLHSGYTVFLRSLSRIAFFGQIQAMLSILFQGALVAQAESRDSDKFIGIISVGALTFSTIIPIDMTKIAVELFPRYGFDSIFSAIRIVFVLLAFGAMYLSPTSKKSNDYKTASVGFFILCVGYIILLNCTSLLLCIIGVLCMIFGTVRFIKCMHRHYMWK